MNVTHIKATDIPDAWFQCVYELMDSGHKYTVEHGSFVGETRLEFDYAVVHIKHPYREPWDLMLPRIPAHLGIPNPVELGYVNQYLPYLMTNTVLPGEEYTYGSRIMPQMDRVLDLLKKTPMTNQAILQVGRPLDSALSDPPCLRHIDLRVMGDKLHFFPYFRSWDLWGGLPANLAGLAVLQQWMAEEIGLEVGEMIAASKGLHIYGYAEELAKIRTGR